MPPYGRGGTGNIRALAQETSNSITKNSPSDLEANRSPSLDEAIEAQVLADCLRAQNELPDGQRQYAHTGRGGMGNYVESRELSKVASSVGENDIPMSNGLGSSGAYGRGGAGNREFSANVREEEQKRRDVVEAAARERVRADVEKDVSEKLSMPAKVLVAVKMGRSRQGSD